MIGRKASEASTRSTSAAISTSPNSQCRPTPRAQPTRGVYVALHHRARHASICGMTSDRSLIEDEHLVLRLHPHWKTLVGPLLVAVIAIAVALAAEVLIPSGSAGNI